MKIINKILIMFVLIGAFLGVSNSTLASSSPTLVSASAINITKNSATLSGTINPNGLTTTAWYEMPDGGPFQTQNLLNGTSPIQMLGYTVTGLNPNTTYTFRIVYGNSAGNITGEWVSFTTLSANSNGGNNLTGSVPSLVSASAINITKNSATLSGTINPNGLTTTAWYEMPDGGPFQTQNLLNGTSPIQMLGYTVTGLNPNTTYTFRIVYGNSAGNITGEWVSFTTANSNGTGGGSGTGGNGNGSGGSGGGGGCNTLPIITNITPNFVTTGSTARSITINGFNFINNTTIAKINSNSRPINFIDSSKIEINLLASDMASSGTASIITTNDSWCNSNSVTLTIGQNTNTTNTSGGGGGGGLLIYSPTTSNTNATNITSNSVKLNSSISSNGSTPVVWFEYGTNSNLSSFNETIHIAPDSSNGYFSQDLTNLNPDTIYYFRSAINNSYGTSKSNIVSFKTLANPSLASTIQVTNQTQSSAKLNAIFINQNNISAQGYFEYGNTLDLGNTTTLIDLGSSNSMFSSTIINLKSDTVYYFRGIVKTSDKIYRGDILSFKTNTININTAQNTNTIIKEENTSSKLESSIIDIKNDKDFLDIGDEVEYIVNINNNTNEELKNVKIYIQLPKEIDPIKANLGQISNDNNVIFDFDTLPIAQIGTIKITGKVNSKALDQSTLVTTAILSYSTNNHPANIDEIAYSTNHIKTNGQLSANVNFSGVNFLPSTLIEWIMLLIIILGITMIVRYYLLP